MAAKYTSDESGDGIDEVTSGVSQISFPVTVLSWNIYGVTGTGMAKARKIMLKSVIKDRDIEPDVMLLQETVKSIEGFFDDAEISKEDYNYEEAQNEKEARVIYKKSAFEKVENSIVDEKFLDTILAKAFPGDETVGRNGGRQTIKNRSCVVHLRHKPSRCEIIFVSYHNIYKDKRSTAMATKFCKIIADIHESSGYCVIAGVDFNTKSFESEDVEVPNYEETPRRKVKNKIDYFIVRNSTVNWKVESVKSFDPFPGDNDARFHENLQSLSASSTKDHYDKALDHDPLVLQLKNKKEEGESEKEKMHYVSVLPLKAVKTEGDGGSIISTPQEEEQDDEGESEKEKVKKAKLPPRLKTN